MDNDKLQEKTVIDEGRRLFNVLNFQDFVQESKKGKHNPKKSKPIKNRKEFIDDDMRDDIIDPNETPERYVKIREEFIKDELQ